MNTYEIKFKFQLSFQSPASFGDNLPMNTSIDAGPSLHYMFLIFSLNCVHPQGRTI